MSECDDILAISFLSLLSVTMIKICLVFSSIIILANCVCLDVTYDDCDGATFPFETDNGISFESCQTICGIRENCTFFIHNRATDQCDYYDYNPLDYDTHCKTVGGTKGTSISQCQSSNEPCDVRFS